MKQLVFATNNLNKIKEVKEIFNLPFTIYHLPLLNLKDINCNGELPETSDTVEGNAAQKARFVYENYHYNCFADDTGLEIEALDGRPGVYSARYAGIVESGKVRRGESEQKSYFHTLPLSHFPVSAEDNINKILSEMQGIENRKAKFRTVICLIIDGKEKLFEGAVDGVILRERRGTAGFGYDPIFAPIVSHRHYFSSFAEMSLAEKNKFSHRAAAIRKLKQWLAQSGGYSFKI